MTTIAVGASLGATVVVMAALMEAVAVEAVAVRAERVIFFISIFTNDVEARIVKISVLGMRINHSIMPLCVGCCLVNEGGGKR